MCHKLCQAMSIYGSDSMSVRTYARVYDNIWYATSGPSPEEMPDTAICPVDDRRYDYMPDSNMSEYTLQNN